MFFAWHRVVLNGFERFCAVLTPCERVWGCLDVASRDCFLWFGEVFEDCVE